LLGTSDPYELVVFQPTIMIEDAAGAATDHITIARLDNASFATTPVENNFIDLDPAHFSIILRDPSRNADPSLEERVLLQVGTEYDDDLTNITLMETAQ
jgi:hypothetical protein